MRVAPILASCLWLSACTQTLVPDQLCALDTTLREASGLLMVDGELWTVLDGGNPNAIFQLDPATGQVTRTLTLLNAVNTDWEDLAMDQDWVYVGDFGNNPGNRTDLRIYRVPLSALQDEGVTEVLADTILFAYADQTDLTLAYDANNWDCEAFVARNDSLFLISKNWLTSDAYLYALPATPGTQLAVRRDTLPSEGLITGASLNPSNGAIALIGHSTNYSTFAWHLTGYVGNELFSGIAERHEVNTLPIQAEGIVWTTPDSVIFCTEKAGPLPARLYSMAFPLAEALPLITGIRDIRAYPDPAADRLVLESGEAHWVEVFDADGRSMARWRVAMGITEVDVRELPEGLYNLRWEAGGSLPLVIAR